MAKKLDFEEEGILDTSAFASGFEDGLEDICGVVTILSVEYVKDIECHEGEEDFEDDFEMISRAIVSFLSNVQPKWN